ncbi:DNA-binding response regulator [Paenibacillus sp. 598K]|uniref:helix-turn-helix domain-containing protein n=1 Tax=Paenibacillus sp. 598K TaxID=1117987 RepID=UPI000FF91218|nr:helix-turn-helix domain-containing protein [Paenibacillus sp. 598K]GBF78172.1 DNA-binding response regulator [Paenibacillus sp. 598K]
MIRAIIIDDDLTTLDGLSASVPWQRYNIELCGTGCNGREGLELIERHAPQLILTDIYMPVMDGIEMLRQLRADGNEAEVIILSGYEDFKYAQSAVKLRVADYLSKPASLMEIEAVLASVSARIQTVQQDAEAEQELRELWELHQPMTRKLLLKGMLESHFTQSPFFEKACRQLGLSFEDQVFTVVLLEYGIPRSRPQVKRSDLAIYSYAVGNMIEEMSQASKEVLLADLAPHMVALIVCMPRHLRPSTLLQRVKYVIGQYTEQIKTYLKLEVWAAASQPVYSIHELAAAYAKTVDLIAGRKYIDRYWLTDEAKDDAASGAASMELPRLTEDYQRLVRHLVDGQLELAERQVEELGRSLGQHEGLTVQSLRNAIVELIGMLTVALYEKGIQLEDIPMPTHWHEDLERIHHVHDYLDYVGELTTSAGAALAARGRHKHQKTVDFMKRYVQEHYSEELTLDDIAEKVYLTRNYLSQLFKEVTGENYNSYITRVRMEKAKEMMLSGKYKLYEVAIRVGYKNNAYFSQQFKKYTGKSPSEYS